MKGCIFCKIINKEIPSYVVYEDENVLAFLDINPISEGHTLVIPKKHYERLSEMEEEEVSKFSKSLQRVVKLIEEKICKDYNIIACQGKNANQEIFHLHFHIIPRYGKENLFIWQHHKLSEEEAKKVLEKIKE